MNPYESPAYCNDKNDTVIVAEVVMSATERHNFAMQMYCKLCICILLFGVILFMTGANIELWNGPGLLSSLWTASTPLVESLKTYGVMLFALGGTFACVGWAMVKPKESTK